MLNRFFFGSIVFFSVLSLIGVYLVITNTLFPVTSIFSIIFSLFAAFFILKNSALDLVSFNNNKFFLILLVFLLVFIYTVLPSFIIPFTSSDLMNHSRSIRILSDNHGANMDFSQGIIEGLAHEYPLGYRSVGAIFYSLIGNPYFISTILSIIFLGLIAFGVYLISMKWYDNRTALIASFIFLFSITSFYYLLSGYIPQLFATMFFISSIYAFSSKEKLLEIISAIGLISYPDLFAVYIIFLLLQFLHSRKKSLFVAPITALIVLLPEVLGLIVYHNNLLTSGYLIRGGIYMPNFFGLLVFILSIFGFAFLFKKNNFNFKEKNYADFLFFALAPFLYILSVIIRFVINLLTRAHEVQIYQFYMAVKIFYLFLIPLSIAAAYFVSYKLKGYSLIDLIKLKNLNFSSIIIFSLLLFHFIYFVSFSPIIKNNNTFPVDYYPVAERINKLDPGFILVVDSCFSKLKPYTLTQFPYNKLYDNSNDDEINKGRELQLARDFQFSWAEFEFGKQGEGIIISYNNERILKIGESESGDYLLTGCSDKNLPIVFGSEEGVRLYKLN